ncbi:uncharacterized protein LOC117297848 [Asterias rubens]|uniref:uncharacterized protein LOC117297848 n=1 Tax=Asterias rubens TaxID=7604 RepID=UPI001455C9AB|nr:uncharacterized protein LOC117297848 [Asterias rubens]
MSCRFLYLLCVLLSPLLSLRSVHAFGNRERGSRGVVGRGQPADWTDNIAVTEPVVESKHQGTVGHSIEDRSPPVQDSGVSEDETITEQVEILAGERPPGHGGETSPDFNPSSTTGLLRSVRRTSETLLAKNQSENHEITEEALHLDTVESIISASNKEGKADYSVKRGERAKLASKTTEGETQSRKLPVQRRDKRSILTIPGTLWCGPGSEAEQYENLGEDKAADYCCREHDHCPNMIERWASKYGIFNHRLYSISDCECDKRLYKCLQDAGTPKAKVVSKWFFNLLGLSCFELSQSTGCVEYGWFGSCRRYGLVRSAKITTAKPIKIQDTAKNVTTTEMTLTDAATSSDATSVDVSSLGSEYIGAVSSVD